MSSYRLNPTFVRAQVAHLQVAHPGIWEDGDAQLLNDMLEAETELHAFLGTIARQILEAEANAAATGLLLTELTGRKARHQRRSDTLRELALRMMIEAGVRAPMVTPAATLSVRDGPPRVIITDELALPDDYWRVKREPNKLKIAVSLSAGIDIPGAHHSNAEPVLTMRVK